MDAKGEGGREKRKKKDEKEKPKRVVETLNVFGDFK